MNQSPQISIVIPVYQAENTINRCVDSVLGQTFKDYEILLINDGSLDKSGEICDAYAERYDFIRVFHQKNQGPSSARNKGIFKAHGNFLAFIDSDDYVDTDYLENFFALKENPSKTLVQQGLVKSYSNYKKNLESPSQIFESSEFSDVFYSFYFIKTSRYACTKLFDTQIVKENSIEFPTAINFGEDLVFVLDYMAHINQFINIDEHTYHYTYTPHSLSHSYNSYEAEIESMKLVENKLELLYSKFEFDEKAKIANDYYLGEYYTRAVKGLYFSGERKSRKNRIKTLKRLPEKDFIERLKKAFHPINTIQGVFKFLVVHRLFFLLDLFMLIWVTKFRMENSQ